MTVNENPFPNPTGPSDHKTSLTLLREWREYWATHGEVGLVGFVVQVENYIAGLHETIRCYNPDDAQLDHEKRALPFLNAPI